MLERLVEHIVKSLVSEPSSVRVSGRDDGGKRIIEVKVAQEDVARIVGSGGRIFRAIRAVASLVGAHHKKEIFVNIIE